jgi:hypothetical protein
VESIHARSKEQEAKERPAPQPSVEDPTLFPRVAGEQDMSPQDMSPDTVLRLQASAGNAAVVAMLRSGAKPQGAAAQQVATRTVAPEREVQRSVFGAIGDFAGDVWGGVTDAASSVAEGVSNVASAVAGGVSDAAGAVVEGVSGVASAAWEGVTGIASDVWEGAKALGSGVVSWVQSAGRTVWNAISWFGSKAWDVISAIGTWAFEKLALLGTLVWSFISNLPVRFWRLLVDGWEGIKGVFGWLWTGLKGAAGAVWDAVVGTFTWLGDGLGGAMRWLGEGLTNGASWAADFIADPSMDKLIDGLLGTLSWLGDGVKGLGRWAWNGIVAAAKWAWSGIKGLGSWLWDGVLGGLQWCGTVLLHLVELVGLGEALQLLWGLIFRLRPLTGGEIGASESVHPSGLIPYGQVRVDENSYLIKIGQALADLFGTKTSPGAITTMHIIHAPSAMLPPLAVHELTHVAQYEKVGALYMPQALHGQGSAGGYNYGDLVAGRTAGKTFSDFNREQQASICEDYYLVKNGGTAEHGGTEASLSPFIADMRAGAF